MRLASFIYRQEGAILHRLWRAPVQETPVIAAFTRTNDPIDSLAAAHSNRTSWELSYRRHALRILQSVSQAIVQLAGALGYSLALEVPLLLGHLGLNGLPFLPALALPRNHEISAVQEFWRQDIVREISKALEECGLNLYERATVNRALHDLEQALLETTPNSDPVVDWASLNGNTFEFLGQRDPAEGRRASNGSLSIRFAFEFVAYLRHLDGVQATALAPEFFLTIALRPYAKDATLESLLRSIFPQNGSRLAEAIDTFVTARSLHHSPDKPAESGSLSADAVEHYPGQFDRDPVGHLIPRPLTPSALVLWRNGTPLAPGRTLRVTIGARRKTYTAERDNVQATFIVQARPQPWQAVIHSFKEPLHGVFVGIWEESVFERWVAGDASAVPETLYREGPTGVRVLANPLALDLQKLKEGQDVPIRPQGSSWRQLELKAHQIGERMRVTVSAQPFGVLLHFAIPNFKEHGIKNGESLIVTITRRGRPVAEIYRATMGSDGAKKVGKALATYGYSPTHGGWHFISDLGALEVIEWNSGRTDFAPSGLWMENWIASQRPFIEFHYRTDSIQIGFSQEEIDTFGLRQRPIYLRIKSLPKLGLYAEVAVREGARYETIQTRIAGSAGSVPMPLERWRFLHFISRGHRSPLAPVFYAPPDPLPPRARNTAWQLAGERLEIFGIGELRKGHRGAVYPVFDPQPDPQWSWRIHVHHASAYKKNPDRAPDLVLVRHPTKKRLVPIESFARYRQPTSEDYLRFEKTAERIGLIHLLIPSQLIERSFVSLIAHQLIAQAQVRFTLDTLTSFLSHWAQTHLGRRLPLHFIKPLTQRQRSLRAAA